MRVLTVIPARAGSKGLPGKNVRPLAGKPLLVWTIEAALAAGLAAADVVVSTDSPDIAAIARQAGATVPFLRPPELATDDASSLAVLQHAVANAELRTGAPYQWILLLQPTSPLRRAADILAALSLAGAAGENCDSVVSVTERPAHHPRLASTIAGDGYLKPFIGSLEGVRRQDCRPVAVFNNGAIYLTRRDVLMHEDAIFGRRAAPLVMPRSRSIDIDDVDDILFAEFAMSRERKLSG